MKTLQPLHNTIMSFKDILEPEEQVKIQFYRGPQVLNLCTISKDSDFTKLRKDNALVFMYEKFEEQRIEREMRIHPPYNNLSIRTELLKGAEHKRWISTFGAIEYQSCCGSAIISGFRSYSFNTLRESDAAKPRDMWLRTLQLGFDLLSYIRYTMVSFILSDHDNPWEWKYRDDVKAMTDTNYLFTNKKNGHTCMGFIKTV